MILRRNGSRALLFLLVVAGGCGIHRHLEPQAPPAGRVGETTVYLQPCPPEADSLRFEVRGVEALAEDGSRVALVPALEEIRGPSRQRRQTILAAGVLPPGPYRGLSLTVGDAFLLGEGGESSLLVPVRDVVALHPFTVSPKRATILFLKMLPEGNVEGGIAFTPSFTLSRSRSDLPSLLGYVTHSESDSVTVFNKVTMEVTGVFSTGKQPQGIVLDNLRNRAFVALAGDAAVEVIDLFKGNTEGVVPLLFGDLPHDVALTRDGRLLVVVNKGSNTVSLVDAVSLVETRRIHVGQRPESVVIHRDGVRAFVMNALSNTVSVLDLTRGVLEQTFSTEGSPIRGAFDRSGRRLFVIQANTPYLATFEDRQYTVSERTFVGMGATFITATHPSDLLLVALASTREIAVIDPFSSVVINAVAVPGKVAYMAFDSQESSLFAVLPEQRRLVKVNVNNGRLLAEIELSPGAYAVAVRGVD